ncbi:Phosphoenolpyruvate/pyruvate domain-containing protein [Cylindrobasidium torrendii FP15055 ss-10]|uniref:Phosphoenolpyruvate/pyruvate domain-containing protein n=1 Tax=Cylindrobasidium torrendii FP15055 ss-10 TaxID=1314674 RepID=A0A0D7AZM7_9AGAR|nr:Phosphoenolpyruvate/pyruvate domain-containing protein [Cylindrobasidium torrendii FP15055 ss-10]
MDGYPRSQPHQPLSLRQALRSATKADGALLGTILGLRSLDVAKIIARTNCDWVAIDAEHDPCSAKLLSEMIQTMRTHSQGRIIPVVRIPSHSSEWISWAMDAGAGGIILPHAESVEQVQSVVNASKLPLSARRLSRPFFGHSVDSDQEDGRIQDNVHVGIIPQIESIQGAESAEGMMQIPEVDAIMVDQLELLKDADGSVEKTFEIIRRIEELAAKYNKPLLAVLTDKNDMPAKLRAGYRMVLVSADGYALASATNITIAEFRKMSSVQEEEHQEVPADAIVPVKEEEVQVVERALGPTIEERKVASQILFSRLTLGMLLMVALSFIRAHIISWVY